MDRLIVAVANQKGGVGKTTTAVTLAHGLALKGKLVLLVDLDPQGHVGFCLGMEKKPALYQLIVEEQPLKNVVAQARPGLDVVLSDKRTEAVKRFVTTLDFRERVLARLFAKAPYDVIVLDTAPSLDVLHVAALLMSDWVIIPTKLDAMAVDGVNEILKSIGEISRQGHPFKGYSILPTFFDRTTRETATQLQELVKVFSGRVWPPIPQDTRAREAAAFGKSLWEYCPESSSITGYPGEKNRVGGYAEMLKRIQEVERG